MTMWDFFDRHWFLAFVAFIWWPFMMLFAVAAVVDSINGCRDMMMRTLRIFTREKKSQS